MSGEAGCPLDAGHLYTPRWIPKGAPSFEPKPGQCRAAVHEGGRGAGFYQCSRRAKVTRTVVTRNSETVDVEYCSTHDPVFIKAKAEKWRADYDAKRAREQAHHAELKRQKSLADAAIAAIKQIAAGHNDPRTLALELLAEHGPTLTPSTKRKDEIMDSQAVKMIPGGAPDKEVAALMGELSRLQTWCVMMSRKDSGGMPAADLVQRTRVLIVERLYPAAGVASHG